MNPRLDFLPRPAAEDRIEEVDELLDVAGGRFVFAVPQVQPDILLTSQESVHPQRRPIGLFEAHWIPCRFGIPGIHHQPARRDERQQGMLVDRQLVLTTGEEPQSRMKPVRLDAGQQLNALVGERLGGVPPRVAFAAVAARRYNGPDPLVEGRRQQRLLPVA